MVWLITLASQAINVRRQELSINNETDTIMKNKSKPKDVDAYITAAPTEVQPKLNELRALIRKTAPAAVERISYGMPYYEYKGRLAYFSIWRTHIGVYIP